MIAQTGDSSAVAIVSRIFWMMLGPIMMFVLAVCIVRFGGGWWTALDMVYLVTLPALVIARLLEFQAGQPQTTTGEPATFEDLQRYSIGVVGIGTAVWVLANLLGNHWLPR
jgi:hypothetical protein